jgi:hypothetical protein
MDTTSEERTAYTSGEPGLTLNIFSICRCFLNVGIYKWKFQNWKIEIISLVLKLSTDPDCRFLCIGQYMKALVLYLVSWHMLFVLFLFQFCCLSVEIVMYYQGFHGDTFTNNCLISTIYVCLIYLWKNQCSELSECEYSQSSKT